MPQGLENEMIANAILYAGQPEMQELEVETQDTLAPGRLVITGTNQWQCKVGVTDTVECIGIADIASDRKLTAMQTETIAGTPLDYYDAGEQIRVLRGDIVVKVLLDSGQTITVGDRLKVVNDVGMAGLTVLATDTVGYALENITSGNYCKWILMKMTI